jgi:MoaA/NifB/PqqE/SkfB family radical SAM enzyme
MPMTEPLRPKPAVKWSERRHVGRKVADVHGKRGDVALAQPHPGLQALAEWLTPSFYLDFGRPCNSACLYCAVPPHEDAQGFTPPTDLPGIITAGLACGCDRAILIGGEPTIYPHLDHVLELLRDAGLASKHIVMTNGLKLADRGFLDRLVTAGVGTVHISVDTADSATYDRLSRSTGRLGQQLQGLDHALTQAGLNTYVYTATSAVNAPTLPGLLQDLHDRSLRLQVPPPPVLFAVVKPIGDGLRHAEQLLLPPRASADLVGELVRLGDSLGITVGFRNVQACLLPELVARNVDYYLDDFSVEVATGARKVNSHAEYWRKAPQCQGCGHDALCTGIYRDLQERYGDAPYVALERQGLV